MNSASQEFSHTFNTLTEELNFFKTRYNELKLQVSKLYEENKRLNAELKENIVLKAQQLSENGVTHLEWKLETAFAAKNAAIEMWQEAIRQLEKQEEQLLGKRSILEVERNEADKIMERTKDEYVKGLNILSTELTNYRSECSKMAQDLKDKTAELDSLKTNIDSLNSERTKNREIISNMTSKKQEMDEKIASLQELLSETENFLSGVKNEMELVKAENLQLSSQVSEFKDHSMKLRNAVASFEKDAKESLRVSQEAVLQKKEMAYREEEYLKEIEHLKDSVKFEAEKIALSYKSEMKEISKQFEKKIKTLMKEIESLHQEISDKQSLFEKATREKQALESKLELLFSECSTGFLNSPVEDLCKRLTSAERTRDELQYTVRSLETRIQELTSAKDQEIACLTESNAKLSSRTDKLKEDFNQFSSDRVKLSDEVARCKKRCNELEKELKSSKAKEAYEIALCNKTAEQNQKVLIEKLQSMEDHYEKKCIELQSLLDAQFKISNKWKEEVDVVIVKSELKIKELCQTVGGLQNQNRELCEFIATR